MKLQILYLVGDMFHLAFDQVTTTMIHHVFLTAI